MKFGKKIILHNLTFRGIEVVPGLLDFDQRGLVRLDKGDIIITKNLVEQDYLNYLEELGWNFSGCSFLNPATTKDYIYNTIFYDKDVIAKIKGVEDYEDYYLDTYNTTLEEEKFAEKTRIPIYANCKLSQLHGTKSGFRKLARKLGLKVVDGFEGINDIKNLKRSLENLFADGKSEAVIKIDEGISGAGTTKIRSSKYKNLSPHQRLELLNKSLYKVKQTQPHSGVVVEKWLPNIIASPSVQIEVYPNKTWKIVSMHEQLLEGDERWYVGCRYPQVSLSKVGLKSVLSDTAKFTEFLISKNFIGFFGLDLIITDSSEIFWIEANMRKTGTFYPRVIAEKLNDGSSKGAFYIAADFTAPKFKGISFSDVRKEFSQLLYPIDKKLNGIVFYNIGPLKEAGRFDLVCFGHDQKSAQAIYKEVKEKLKH